MSTRSFPILRHGMGNLCRGSLALLAVLALLGDLHGARAAETPAPDFTLPLRGGGEVTLSSLKGQVVMLNFWASWCGPCRQEMPLLDAMHKQYESRGFRLLGVNVEADLADAERWLAGTPVGFPILFDRDNAVTQRYAVNAMPSTVFIDRRGNVRYVHRGYKPGDEAEYLDQLKALLEE